VLVSVLGATELYGVDGSCVHLGGLRRRAVFAALALEINRPVTVERLLGIVWDERPPAQARAALQGHIAALRRLLPPALSVETRDGGYRLTGEAEAVDSARFANLVARSVREPDDAVASRRLAEALGLWRGDALADLLTLGFFHSISGTMRQTRARAAELWAWRELRMGEGARAIPQIQSLLHDDPTRESLVSVLMLCLYQDGRRAQALEAYQQARELLSRELGTRPGPVLQDALAQILRGAEKASPVATETAAGAATLPRPHFGFVGRRGELAALDALAEGDGGHGASRIAVVTGGAGVGKTALLLHWGHRVSGRFADGCLYADLKGTSGDAQPARVLREFLGQLGVPASQMPESVGELATLFRERCRGRRVLVLLDDVREAEQVHPLLPVDEPGCVTVVASRFTPTDLAVDCGAVLIPVPPLAVDEARQLLDLHVGAERPADDEAATTRLIELCDRWPLALRLAASRLALRPSWGIRDVVGDPVRERDFLDAIDEGCAGALDATRRRLSAGAAELLPWLGERGEGPIEADRADVAGALRNLAAWNLVHETSPGTYAWTGLVGRYARRLKVSEHVDARIVERVGA